MSTGRRPYLGPAGGGGLAAGEFGLAEEVDDCGEDDVHGLRVKPVLGNELLFELGAARVLLFQLAVQSVQLLPELLRLLLQVGLRRQPADFELVGVYGVDDEAVQPPAPGFFGGDSANPCRPLLGTPGARPSDLRAWVVLMS